MGTAPAAADDQMGDSSQSAMASPTASPQSAEPPAESSTGLDVQQASMSADAPILGLSDNVEPVAEPEVQTSPDAMVAETDNSQVSEAPPAQSGDWFTEAFGSKQGGAGDQRQTAARAAQEEELRVLALETIVVDENDTTESGGTGNTVGQNMGRS